MKATQLGFTEVGNNWFLYVADTAPGPMLMLFPTDKLGREHSKQKLGPTIEETPSVREKIRTHRIRETGNNLDTKEFPGGILYISGSNTPVAFRSKSIRYLFLDDIDGYEADVGGEGDPVNLAKKRTDTFSNRKKIYEVSTPTIKGFSRIESSFLESDQRRYFVPCPHCREMQPLEWGNRGEPYGIKFTRDDSGDVVSVWYECRHCHAEIRERQKTWMLEHGQWRPLRPGAKKRGYQLSSLYSPLGWVPWAEIVTEFLQAKDSPERLKTWYNTRLGLPFEAAGERPEWSALKARGQAYNLMVVPAAAGLLTAGVDTQDNRLAVVIRAWGRGEESWLVYWGELYGDPAERGVWDQLDGLLNTSFVKSDGGRSQIVSMAIDAMGHRTQAVYNYCRFRWPRVIATQGSSKRNRPVLSSVPSDQDVTFGGAKIKNGVKLWTVGADSAKTIIYARLKLEAGPGSYHWPAGLPDEYFMQLASEKLVSSIDRKTGRRQRDWIKTRERNEALDCEVLAYAAAIRAGLVIYNPMAPEAVRRATSAPPAGGSMPSERERPAVAYSRPEWMNR
jgi:phage terminase large subunit GpA-like protein